MSRSLRDKIYALDPERREKVEHRAEQLMDSQLADWEIEAASQLPNGRWLPDVGQKGGK
jgi:hypothetical protein